MQINHEEADRANYAGRASGRKARNEVIAPNGRGKRIIQNARTKLTEETRLNEGTNQTEETEWTKKTEGTKLNSDTKQTEGTGDTKTTD